MCVYTPWLSPFGTAEQLCALFYACPYLPLFTSQTALHTVPFTLFWLITMSSTLPKAEWGEVYFFVRRYTKYWHAFMQLETATQQLQNGDVYNWTSDDAHAWCELMQAMEKCHSGNGATSNSLQDLITLPRARQSSRGEVPRTSEEDISNVNTDFRKLLAPLFDKYKRSTDQGTANAKVRTSRLRGNQKDGPKVGIRRKSAWKPRIDRGGKVKDCKQRPLRQFLTQAMGTDA